MNRPRSPVPCMLHSQWFTGLWIQFLMLIMLLFMLTCSVFCLINTLIQSWMQKIKSTSPLLTSRESTNFTLYADPSINTHLYFYEFEWFVSLPSFPADIISIKIKALNLYMAFPQVLEPDPIITLKHIIGFGGGTFRDVSRFPLTCLPPFHKYSYLNLNHSAIIVLTEFLFSVSFRAYVHALSLFLLYTSVHS